MMLVVTGVGFLIHIYSVGYMWDDDGYYRFMAYLNLFMFFMLTLVLAKNYLMMFIGWEGVGLASYLLIGFWFTKDSAASAGKKAFIVNRIGDFGFLIALFLMIKHFGSLDFAHALCQDSAARRRDGRSRASHRDRTSAHGRRGGQVGADSALRVAAGRDGRPTPVSALIHAATMVTAGVYMVARSHVIFERAPSALTVVADHRHADRAVCRNHRHRADRYQESSGLLHRLAARLHVHGVRRGSVLGRHLSPDDACIL